MAWSLPMPAWVDVADTATRAQIRTPERRITVDDDIRVWGTSEAHDAILLFVMRMAEACVGAATTDVAWDAASAARRTASSDPIERVLGMLQTLDAWTDEIEPQTSAQRFGNLSFRTWGKRLQDRVDVLHTELLPTDTQLFIPELRAYLAEAFGSFVRIDYGTGHELNFVAWLGYLHRTGFFAAGREPEAVQAAERRLALEVFPAYLRVVWHLQDRYSLEPAGSHGVWGLDDYQFVPYILGSAQLRTSETLTPQNVVDLALYPFIKQPGPRAGPRISVSQTLLYTPPGKHAPIPNLYVSSLARIHSLKRGPFSEHSPVLSDVSSNVSTWDRVYKGMLKMYDAECLLKRPVVQHFVFGGVGFCWPSGAPTSVSHGSSAAPSPQTIVRPDIVPGASLPCPPGRGTAHPGASRLGTMRPGAGSTAPGRSPNPSSMSMPTRRFP